MLDSQESPPSRATKRRDPFCFRRAVDTTVGNEPTVIISMRISRAKQSNGGYCAIDGKLLEVEGARNFCRIGSTVRVLCLPPCDVNEVYQAVTSAASCPAPTAQPDVALPSESSGVQLASDIEPNLARERRPPRVRGCTKGERRKWALERSMRKADGSAAAMAVAAAEPRVLVFGVNPSNAVEQNSKGFTLLRMDRFLHVMRLDAYEAAAHEPRDRSTVVDEAHEPRPDSPHDEVTRADKALRNQVFASWLVETYGHGLLSAGSGVLDVGGGKGELCTALNLLGVPCVLMEPNARGLSAMSEEAGEENPSCHGLTTVVVASLEGDGARLLAGLDDRPAAGERAPPQAGGNRWHAKERHCPGQLQRQVEDGETNEEGEEGGGGTAEVPEEEARRRASACRTAALVRGASIVVGMHADAATEPIVDLALLLGVPFAVIPCCVFPQLFPHRTIAVGKQRRQNVRSYRAFCQYLLDKAPAGAPPFRSTHLGFVGKNQVIYSMPQVAEPQTNIFTASMQPCVLCSEATSETTEL